MIRPPGAARTPPSAPADTVLTMNGEGQHAALCARRWIVEALVLRYDNLGSTVEDSELIVSELVTNCVQANAHEIVVRLIADVNYYRIAVTDAATGVPQQCHVDDDVAHGRGLLIVESASHRWWVTSGQGPGKTVWVTMTVPALAVLRSVADLDVAANSTGGVARGQLG